MQIILKPVFKIFLIFIVCFLTAGFFAYFAITFVVKGEDIIVVPNLVGKDIIYTLETLSSLSMNTKVTGTNYSDSVPKNYVINQEPEPGSVIKIHRDIRVTISRGPQTIPVPNIKHLSMQQAEIILEENGLKTGVISKTSDFQVKKDDLICQSPPAGTLVNLQTPVNLLVSTGNSSKQFMMIDFSGLTLDEAIVTMERNGLLPGEIRSEYSATTPINRISHQTPAAGSPVTVNTVANLVINRKNDYKNNQLASLMGVTLFRHRVENGFLKKHVRIRMNCFGINIDLHDRFLEPGEEIWTIVPRNKDVSIFVYENGELVKTKFFTL